VRWIDWGLLTMLVCGSVGCGAPQLNASRLAARLRHGWVEFESGSTAGLRGLSAVDSHTAWASGSGGTVLRHVAPDRPWHDVSVPGASDLDFRMIHAFDADTACALSAGSPARLYRTDDGGASWTLVYEDTRPEIFFDAMRFADAKFGIAFGDPIDGRIQIISTSDGGRTWRRHGSSESPAALPGEAGFAASNSALAIAGETICIGLGGATPLGAARIALSRDRGWSWQVVNTPLRCSQSSGIFSIAVDQGGRGVAVGGDYLQPESTGDNVLTSEDGGLTWVRSAGSPPGGYRSCVVFLSRLGQDVAFAVGPDGTDISTDGRQSWTSVDTIGWHAVSLPPDGRAMWFSGPDGRIGFVKFAASP